MCPWRYFGLNQVQLDLTRLSDVVGVMCIALGVVLLAACIFEFARSGRGTLSPADPPRHLVVCGLYRYVRNPMYLSVTMILLGEALIVPFCGAGYLLGGLVRRSEHFRSLLRGTGVASALWFVVQRIHAASRTLDSEAK